MIVKIFQGKKCSGRMVKVRETEMAAKYEKEFYMKKMGFWLTCCWNQDNNEQNN